MAMEEEMAGQGDPGLEDALEAFWKACQAKDWPTAASEFRDACGLAEGSESESKGAEDAPAEKKSRPLALLLTAKK
jgi:hypothetical protein